MVVLHGFGTVFRENSPSLRREMSMSGLLIGHGVVTKDLAFAVRHVFNTSSVTPFILAATVFEIDKGTRVLTHSPNAIHKRRQSRRYQPLSVFVVPAFFVCQMGGSMSLDQQAGPD